MCPSVPRHSGLLKCACVTVELDFVTVKARHAQRNDFIVYFEYSFHMFVSWLEKQSALLFFIET